MKGAEDFEAVLPAKAGETAWALGGALCCSVVGSEVGELALLPAVSSPLSGWPKEIW